MPEDYFAPPTELDLRERRRQRMKECIKSGKHHAVTVKDIATGLSYTSCIRCQATWDHKPLPKDYNPIKEK